MPWIGAAISAVGGFLGQSEANDSNQQIAQQNSAFNAEEARITRQFNAEQADIGRDYNRTEATTSRNWLEQMSGSSYQRAVRDMQAAGLNPMLAYSQGGASTPGGPTASAGAASGPAASAVQPPPMLNRFAGAMQSAGQAAQLAVTNAQTRKTEAEAAILESEIGDGKEKPDSYTARLKMEQGLTETARRLNVISSTDKIHQEIRNLGAQLELTRNQITKITEEVLNLKEHGRSINLKNLFDELDIPRAHREHEFETSTVGRNYRYTQPIIDQAGRLLHGAGQARRLFNQGGRP